VTVTRSSTRAFFFGGTLLFTIVFIALTIDTHRAIAARSEAHPIPPEVARGLRVWEAQNCENCHTLMGEGAYYAPDLTKIVEQRGAGYLAQFLRRPSDFYSEEEHGRLMPDLGLSDAEIGDVIAFLDWVGKVDLNGWPPRPIHVSGASVRGIPGQAPAAGLPAPELPTSRGKTVFNEVASCQTCHSIEPGQKLIGPSLAGVAEVASGRLKEAGYTGKARTPEEYLRESILEPSAHVVAGSSYGSNGRSFMPATFGQTLTPAQVDDLVAYLGTLR